MAIESISLWHAIYTGDRFRSTPRTSSNSSYDHVRAWLSVFARSHNPSKRNAESDPALRFLLRAGQRRGWRERQPASDHASAAAVRRRHSPPRLRRGDSSSMIAMQKKLPRLKRFSRRKGSKAVRGKSISEATIFSRLFASNIPRCAGGRPDPSGSARRAALLPARFRKSCGRCALPTQLIFMSSSFAARFRRRPKSTATSMRARDFSGDDALLSRPSRDDGIFPFPDTGRRGVLPHSVLVQIRLEYFWDHICLRHAKGAEKFLEAAWKRDKLTGEAISRSTPSRIDPSAPQCDDWDKPTKVPGVRAGT